MSIMSRTAARLPLPGIPVVSWAARTWLMRSFGEPPLDQQGPPGDQGLLGPSSASWQLFADAASIVGGIRSLIVQLTHPLAMAGVSDHSNYLAEPLSRLQDTAAYVALVTFGSSREALDVTARVRSAHRRVVGHAPDGRPYAAGDPELVTWVSAVATQSWLRTDADFGTRPLSSTQRDSFVAEQSRISALLDPRVNLAGLRASGDPAGMLRDGGLTLPLVEEGWLPMTEAALEERMRWFRPKLAVGEQGRETLRFLLWPPVDPLLRLGYLPTLAGAIGTLDPVTRRLLGLPINTPTAAVLRVQSELLLIGLRSALGRPSPNAERATQRAHAA